MMAHMERLQPTASVTCNPRTSGGRPSRGRDLLESNTSFVSQVDLLKEVNLLHNPVSSQVTVLGLKKDVEFMITTIDGRRIKAGKLDQSGKLSITGFVNGQYLLTLSSKGLLKTLPFIVLQ